VLAGLTLKNCRPASSALLASLSKNPDHKVVLLVALGFWTDGSGKREILDWQIADGESKAAWDPFVHRLWERGVRPENGLQAVIRDGCGELGEAVAWVYGTTIMSNAASFIRCAMSPTPAARNSQARARRRSAPIARCGASFAKSAAQVDHRHFIDGAMMKSTSSSMKRRNHDSRTLPIAGQHIHYVRFILIMFGFLMQ